MTKEEREKAIDLLDNLLGMVEDNQDNDYDKALKMGIESLRKEPCEDWHDIYSDEMTLEQSRQAVRDLRGKLAECLRKEPCADAISRKAVLNTIRDWWKTVMMADGKPTLCDSIRELPTVTPTQKWIPCSERLPEIHNRAERYFVTLKCGDIDIAKFTECNGEHWWNFNYDDVVAWQPLPNPYKETESEDGN